MEATTTIPGNLTAMEALSVKFHIADYVVLVLMLVMSLGIGVYHGCVGGKQKSTDEYFRGNSKMGLLPVVLSLLASYISSNGMLGVPAEVYMFGFDYMWIVIGALIGIPVSALWFLPVFYKLQCTSVFEYLERRFDRRIRKWGAFINIITNVIYASFATYGPALALSQVTGLDLWGSIITTTIVGTFYTSLGGIKAVMWADSAQMLIFTTAILIAVIKGTYDVGGVSYIVAKALEGNRLKPPNLIFDFRVRFTLWGFLISTTLGWISGYGCSQLQVQRYLTCPSQKAARKSIYLNFPGMTFVIFLYAYVGLIIYAKYASCDPMSNNQIQQPDQVFPLFVMETMSVWPGVPGLFVAGVYSAALSTTSSVYNSLSAVTLEDFILANKRWKNISDETATKISKLLAIGYAIVCLIMVTVIKNFGSIVQATWYLIGTTIGSGFALFTLGLFWPRANPKGTTVGIVCGIGFTGWIVIGNLLYSPKGKDALSLSTEGCPNSLSTNETINSTMIEEKEDDGIPEIYKVAYIWILPIAWFFTHMIGGITSYFIGSNSSPLQMQYYSPVTRYILKKYYNAVDTEDDLNRSLPPAYEESQSEYIMMVKQNTFQPETDVELPEVIDYKPTKLTEQE